MAAPTLFMGKCAMRAWGVWGAFAVAWLPVAGLAEAPGERRSTHFLGVDAAFDGVHLSAGFDLSPWRGADGRGLTLRATAGSGLSRFRIDPALPDRVSEVVTSARLLAGWREQGSWGSATLFAGLAMETRRLSPALPDRHLGTRLGPAVVLDAWLTPADRVAVQVHATYATPFDAASLRIAPGYRLDPGVHVGPEATLSAHHGTLRTRLGLHITGLTIGPVGLRLSGGYARDRGGGGGIYGGLSLWRDY
jgi:hypothetical protein